MIIAKSCRGVHGGRVGAESVKGVSKLSFDNSAGVFGRVKVFALAELIIIYHMKSRNGRRPRGNTFVLGCVVWIERIRAYNIKCGTPVHLPVARVELHVLYHGDFGR